MSRAKTLQVRLTPDELAEVERRAEAAGLPVAAWVRAQLLGDQLAPDARSTDEARERARARLHARRDG